MPMRYAAQFRKHAVDLVLAGRKPADVAADLGIGLETVYRWRRQAEIDAGLRPGLSSIEADELKAAKRQIRELEQELEATRKAAILLVDETLRPKGDSRSSQL
jgi:transposase